jgi:CubicO group peptidase (beta-lactamase class C family)
MSRRLYFILPVLALLLFSCKESAEKKAYFPPARTQDGWRANTSKEFVESLGLNYKALQTLGQLGTHMPNSTIPGYDDHNHASTIVIKNGWIVGEWYFRPASRTFQQYLSSNGKSFAYVLFGILMDKVRKGELPVQAKLSEQSKLYDQRWMSEGWPLSDPRKTAITFEQVFQHVAGFMPEVDANGNQVERGRYTWTSYPAWVFGHDPLHPGTGRLFFDPGHPEQWQGSETWGQHQGAYSSIGFAHLGIAFRHISGQNPDRILWQWLLEPLGFDGVSYHAPPGGGMYRWFTAGGLRMTARDYARFCWLLLNKGRWQSRQLVAKEWIERTYRSPNYPNMRSNIDGWLGKDLPADTLRIFGSGGNFAYIIPSLNLVALRCGRVAANLAEKFEQKFKEQLLRVLHENSATDAP